MSNTTLNTLSQAILQTVAYSDIFDYPLTVSEIHRYLVGVKASLAEVKLAIEANDLLRQTGEYYTLPGRQEIVKIRKQRETRSRQLLPIALKYGRILGSLPFVRMVALTGSLAVMNASKNADFDYMLVTEKNRVWTARLFAMAVNRLTRLWGWTLCPNLIIAETALEWRQHDLYSARELSQMIPITGMGMYRRLMEANAWVREFLPNASLSLRVQRSETTLAPGAHLPRMQVPGSAAVTEWALRTKLGDKLEGWEMRRKIAKFSRQPGFGEETIFTADMCQGNFDHHSKQTREAFEEKLRTIARNLALSGVNDSERRRSASIEAISSSKEIASSPIGSSQ